MPRMELTRKVTGPVRTEISSLRTQTTKTAHYAGQRTAIRPSRHIETWRSPGKRRSRGSRLQADVRGRVQGHGHGSRVLTKAVPAPTLPVVAPDQYKPPTVKRTKQRNVCSGRRMVRRPNLSDVPAHRSTASRLTHLYVSHVRVCREAVSIRKNQATQKRVFETGKIEEI